MKQLMRWSSVKPLLLGLFFSFLNIVVWAQGDGDSDTKTTTSSSTTSEVTTTSSGTQWYTQPWVWITGAIIFILLLAVLLTNAKKSNRTIS